MTDHVKAVYRAGAFVPTEPCELPEGIEVELIVRGPRLQRPVVRDPAERTRLRSKLVESMRKNPFPVPIDPWRRDELHDRG
jgi:predicted DNA-binding antitoxin AbrB/MazE fold protein